MFFIKKVNEDLKDAVDFSYYMEQDLMKNMLNSYTEFHYKKMDSRTRNPFTEDEKEEEKVKKSFESKLEAIKKMYSNRKNQLIESVPDPSKLDSVDDNKVLEFDLHYDEILDNYK